MTEVHEFLAEPLAEAPQLSQSEEMDVAVTVQKLLDPCARFGQGNFKENLPVKHLGPTVTLTELLKVATEHMQHLGTMPSYRTFVRLYHSHWKRCVRFRSDGIHSKCTACERFKQWQRVCSSVRDHELVVQAYVQHINGVMSDRRLDALWREHGRNSVKFGEGASLHAEGETWLTLTIDGMECAKFKIPRNVPSTKKFAVIWPLIWHLF